MGAYSEILDASTIENINPNRGRRDVVFIGFPSWGWGMSSPALETARMSLLKKLGNWEDRFRILFAHPVPTVQKRLKESFERLNSWLLRAKNKGVPSTLVEAKQQVEADAAVLRELADLLPEDEYAIRVAVDTNTLIDDPDLAEYIGELGKRYMVHLLPVVLRELDELKRSGKTEIVRDGARKADRRLKGIRSNGDVTAGVRVVGEVFAVFEHLEPKSDLLPSWLDLSVPDDRFVASVLLLQAEHPRSALYVATSDLNLQTKLAAIRMPFIEQP